MSGAAALAAESAHLPDDSVCVAVPRAQPVWSGE